MDSLMSTRQALYEYSARGWSIIPIRARDKRPLVPWDEFQHRHPDQAIMQGWFRRWPDAGIGIVTGAVSGLVVLDVDVQHGGDLTVQQLEEEHGRMPITVECRTGGGGRHLYFAHPGGRIGNRVGLALGVDVRGDAGYVVAPPSTHVSG